MIDIALTYRALHYFVNSRLLVIAMKKSLSFRQLGVPVVRDLELYVIPKGLDPLNGAEVASSPAEAPHFHPARWPDQRPWTIARSPDRIGTTKS